MTEDDAKTKWCPFARVLVDQTRSAFITSANRLPGIGNAPDPDLDWPSARCIGSACMAWQADGGLGQQHTWMRSTFDALEAEQPGVYAIVPGSFLPNGQVRVECVKPTGGCALMGHRR